MWWAIYIQDGGNGQLNITITFIFSLFVLVNYNIYHIYCFFVQVTDLTLAKENQTHFQEYLSNNQAANPGMELTVTVLTTGFWPSYKSSDLSLPTEMVGSIFLFIFYGIENYI